MLYDCRRDNYMSDSPVGDPEALAEATTRVPQEMFKVKIIDHDSFVEKANCLEIDNELQLSLLSGLVDVQGAAKFLTAHRSSVDHPRISLVYQSTTRLEELSLEKVASQCADTRIDRATHMVTKVQYGANAAFVFDASGYTHDDLLAKISELKKSLSTSRSAAVHADEKAEAADIMCTFHADIPCPKEPATFSEARLLCCSLASHLKGKDHCVPMKIWLCPLGELNNRAHKLLLHEVSPKLADKIKEFFDSLNDSEMQSKHVINNQVCKHFHGIKSDLKDMIEMLVDYSLMVRKKVATLLPQVREGAADEAKLVEILDDMKNSPFNCNILKRWIVEKEKEVKVLSTYIRTFEQEKRIRFEFQPDDMDTLSKSMDIDTIVCLDFNISARDVDNQLANMRAYLHRKEATCSPCREEVESPRYSQRWYNNASIAKEMRRQAQLFKQLAADNVKQDNIAFAVTSGGSEVAKRPDQIPCLCLYTEDSEPVIFEPPGKPGKPQASLVGSSSIQLTWERPKCGASTVESYTILYHYTNDQPDRWNTQSSKNNTTTITTLPCHKYVFKVRAETSVLTGPESEPSEPIVTQSSLLPPGKPYAANITHCSVTLQWNKPQSGHEQNIKFYTVHYCTLRDPPDEWKTHKTSDAQAEAIITDLSSATTYFFKVRAETNFESSPESEISDACETKQRVVIAPTGKPFAANVTHNSITLKWDIPENRDRTCFPYYRQAKFPNGVHAYTIKYRSINDPPVWQSYTTKKPVQQCEISSLNPETRYIFKVIALTSQASSQVSKASNEIQTKPQPSLAQPECVKKSPTCIMGESSKASSIPSEATDHDAKVVLLSPGKPHATCVTHNSVQLNWDKPQNGADEKHTTYTLYIRSDRDPPNKWSICSTTYDASFLVANLQQCTVYFFKVSARSSSGYCKESVASDPIKTKIHLSQPGKPYAIDVTHNSIQLGWDRPAHGVEMVESYKISYRSTQNTDWSTSPTEGSIEGCTCAVANLQQQTAYIFKVSAVTSESDKESEISNTIETKRIPFSSPGKPYKTGATHNSIQLKWDKPTYGAEMVESYEVFYHSTQDQLDRWSTCSAKPCCDEYATVSELQPQTSYVFKVLANGLSGFCQESAVSDPIETKVVVSPPGQPYPNQISRNSIQLKWDKPAVGAEMVMSYKVYHHVSRDPGKLVVFSTNNTQACCTVSKLHQHTNYTFKVAAETPAGESKCSEASEVRTADVRLAERLLPSCTKVCQKGNLWIYKLKTIETMRKEEIVKVDVGVHLKSLSLTQHKVLMVVGATGAGKSTLINGIANYILGVNWEDEFRFQLIFDSERGGSQTKSQTRHITAYTFHQRCSNLPYTLTVIDTPGFGDTEGVERDKKILDLIREFFSSIGDEGIEQLHAIGFVAQATQARLTPTQKYIFHTILTIFGKDIGNNIFLMATFSDGEQPLVLQAVNEAEVPYQNHFKFNNSALFASTLGNSVFNSMFWAMGMTSFTSFFDWFSEVEPKSLTLTKEVQQEREQLKVMIQGLHPQICKKLKKREELEQVESALKKHKDEIESNKNFMVKVPKPKKRRIQLPDNRNTTVCYVCEIICHPTCTKAKSEDKRWCFAMKTDLGRQTARCGVCPGKCSWRDHYNAHFLIEDYVVEEETTYEDIKARYDLAVTGKNKQESVIAKLKKEIENHNEEVSNMMDRVKQCYQRLNEIALKPTAAKSEVEYIEVLIESTKQTAKPGWEEEVKSLEEYQREAQLTVKATGIKS